MAKLLTSRDVARILDAQPLSEVREWLTLWATPREGTPTLPVYRMTTLLEAFGGAVNTTDQPFQLTIDPGLVNIPLTGGLGAQHFNVSLVDEAQTFVRLPETIRSTFYAKEIKRPRFFPEPRPR